MIIRSETAARDVCVELSSVLKDDGVDDSIGEMFVAIGMITF